MGVVKAMTMGVSICVQHIWTFIHDMCMCICNREWYYRCMDVVMAINMIIPMGVCIWIFTHGHVYVLAVTQDYLKMK